MAYTVKIIFGAVALATSLGVAQLAVGGDLAELRGGLIANSRDSSALNGNVRLALGHSAAINRAAKSDRVAAPKVEPGQAESHTISVRLIDQADSSFLVRISTPSSNIGGDARRTPLPSLLAPAGKAPIACEPMVSVLTDIAKQLQPGRCVT